MDTRSFNKKNGMLAAVYLISDACGATCNKCEFFPSLINETNVQGMIGTDVMDDIVESDFQRDNNFVTYILEF